MEACCALCNKRRENNEGSQTRWDKIGPMETSIFKVLGGLYLSR